MWIGFYQGDHNIYNQIIIVAAKIEWNMKKEWKNKQKKWLQMDLDRISWIVDIIYEKKKIVEAKLMYYMYVVLIKPSIDSAAEISNTEQKHATKCKLHKI